jgi:putative endonuclease
MAAVYILHSIKLGTFYTGSCFDLQERVMQHQNHEFITAYTAKSNDWILFLSIENLEYNQARNIEKHIKSMKSSTYIRNLKQYHEMKTKLIEKYQ